MTVDVNNAKFKIPQDLESEMAILGAMMFDIESCEVAIQGLQPEYFFDKKNSAMFIEIVRIRTEGVEVNIETIGALPSLRQLKVYVSEIAANFSTTRGVVEHVKNVKNAFLRRECVRFFSQWHEFALTNEDPAELIESVQAFAVELHDKNSITNLIHIKEAVKDVKARVQGVTKDVPFGVSTGFKILDKYLHGLEPGKFYIVAGRPGVGKSTFAAEVVRNSKAKTAVFSLEMDSVEWTERMMSAAGGFAQADMKTKEGLVRCGPLIDHASTVISDSSVWIDDSPDMTVDKILSQCRAKKLREGLDLIVIDYLQYMGGNDPGKRYEQVTRVSMGLKRAAKSLNVPILAVAALRRADQGKENNRPTKEDLRESGQIEYDAHGVILIHRNDDRQEDLSQEAEIIIAKNRGGRTGMFRLRFDKEMYRYVET